MLCNLEELAVSEAHKKASYKYNSARDNIMIRAEKAEGAQIRAAASSAGESLQGYILRAVRDRMEQEQKEQGK